ncbi:MAG: pectinesterase family protein, partial [Clostridia bacterium]|nr:pectinesterase family protein [Clostridia bacterium]
MKNGSKRTISRVLAFVMLVTSMFANIVSANTDNGNASVLDDVISSASAVIEDIVDLGAPISGDIYWTADDLADANPLTESPALDAGGVFTYTIIDGKSKVNQNGKIFSDGTEFAKRLQAGGTGKVDTKAGAFTLNAPSAGILTVYAITGTNDVSRTVEVYDASGAPVGEVYRTGGWDTTPTSDQLIPMTVEIPAAGEYTIVGTGGAINYYGMSFSASGSEDITEESTTEETTTEVTTSNQGDTPAGEAVNFELWLDDEAVDGVVSTGVRTYGGSTLQLNGASSNGEEVQFTIARSEYQNIVRAGKTVNAYQAGARYGTPNDIAVIPKAGEGSCVVFTPAATGMFNAYVYTTRTMRVWDFDTASGERIIHDNAWYIEAAAGESPLEFAAFKAEAGHTYVLSTTGSTSNLGYAGFEYVVDEPITVGVSYNNIDAEEAAVNSLQVYLTDAALGTVAASVTKDTATINIEKGHTYIVSTNDGGVEATINGSDTYVAADESPVTIDLRNIPDVTLTGKFTGTPAGTVTSVTFTNMVNGNVVEGTVNGEDYTAVMKPGEYNTSVVTSNGGVTYDRVSVKSDTENVNEVYVELPEDGGSVTYNPSDLDKLEYTEGLVTARANDITAKPGAAITVPVKGSAVVTVSAYYAAHFTINGGEVIDVTSGSTNQIDSFSVTTGSGDTSVVIGFVGEETSYLTSISVVPIVEFKTEINVPGDYDTLADAVTAIKGMTRPEGEEGRVTINLTADIQEQIVFDAPYITLNGKGHEISWYYGIGTNYYSIDSATGLYSERLFRDKYSATGANENLWGGVAIIRGDNFIAVDTTFKNTYNYYVTDKELEDVASTTLVARTKDADVAQYAAKERSNAFYIDADNIEVYNCNILSSQDTLGRNGSANNGYHTYFKDCVIGGNVDYICGEFTAVFDNCELQWKSFTNDTSNNNAKIGYIAAPKTSPYIFRNCTVTTDSDVKVSGLYGRTWGADSLAYFINTETNGTIKDEGWGEMNSGDALTAKFYEHNNTYYGLEFGTTTNGLAMTDEDIAKYIDNDVNTAVETALNGWTPVHYEYKLNPVVVRKIWGNVDGDKSLTVLDAAMVLQYTLKPETVTGFDASVADVSDNGTIDSEDVALILQKVLNSQFKFPIEENGKIPPVADVSSETTTEATTDAPTETTTTEPVAAPAVYVLGDSTACDYAETEDTSYFYKRVGFGTMLKDYFDADTTVVNLALSGRSSKSFAAGINENGAADASAEANYAQFKNDIKAGDYVIIAFGHNDEKTDAYRGTTPAKTAGDYTEEGSFEKSLYDNYIKVALDAGATPILCTSTVRRQASITTDEDKQYTGILWGNNDIHVTAAGDYPAAVKALAAALNL